MDPTLIAVIAVLVSIGGPLLGYFVGDLKAKARAEVVDLATKAALDAMTKEIDSQDARIKALEISTAVDRSAINQVGMSVASLRSEMDRRFDQLERIISGSGLHKRSERE